MPQGKKAAGAGAAKKPRAPKGHALAEKFPNGEVLKDLFKKEWRLGDVIGQGGFGLIYLASNEGTGKVGADAKFVIKIEPVGNGPLFCEQHFYQRVAKADFIDAFVKKHKLKYLGVPEFIASGLHDYKGTSYRFMVMQRFSTDLQKIFIDAGSQFSQQSVFALALRLLDALEYIHEMNYVHADVKASNCLLGFKSNKTDPDSVYLVDYGLANKFNTENGHKVYKEDPRKAHDGTIEFTSRDAHKGVDASRRSDLEILGYCLLQWLSGRLPWEDKLTDPNYVASSKEKFMGDIKALMKKCFPQGNGPGEISAYLTSVNKLKYDEKPDYKKLREIFHKGLTGQGVKDTWKLALPLGGAKPKSPKKCVKRPSSGADVDQPAKQKLKVDSKPATPKAKTKPATPKVQKNQGTPKTGRQAGTPKAQVKPATPKTGGKPVPKKGAKKAVTPKAKKTVPSNPPKSTAASPATARVVGKRAIEQSESPVPGTSAVNGGPIIKRRKAIRRKNVQSMEIAVQTSPGLKKNR